MNFLEKKLAITRLTEWKELHDELEALHTDAKKLFGCKSESPFSDTTWRVFDAYTYALAYQLGDKGGDWMQWYLADNKMGELGLSAGYDGKCKPIKTLTDLYDLICQKQC